MGIACCAVEGYPKNADINAAKNRFQLVDALRKIQDKQNLEIEEIEDHFKKGTPLTSDFLKGIEDSCLKERGLYLAELNASLQELITVIYKCSDELPIGHAKDILQNCYSHYYTCFDKDKKYRDDEYEFKDFAVHYMRILD